MTPLPQAAFDWQPRTRVVFGVGCAQQCGQLAASYGWRRVLLVTDPGLMAAGLATAVADSLRAAGLTVAFFSEVQENPTTTTVAAALAAARQITPDAFVAVGGGSSLDCAKGCNFLYTNGGVMADYWGHGKAKVPLLPMMAVPTTAGTGSEVQSYALISQEGSHRKMACGEASATPVIAVLDPLLTLSLPPRITATAGIDAVTHAVEVAVTRTRNPISAMLAQRSLALTLSALPRVMAQPDDLNARGEMLLGACWAGLAIENSMLGAAHAAANPLTANCELTHGHAVALMLPAVVAYNACEPDIAAAYAQLAAAVGLTAPGTPAADAVALLISRLRELLVICGLSSNLRQAGVPAVLLPTLAEQANQQWTARHNPREVTDASFLALYQAAWAGEMPI